MKTEINKTQSLCSRRSQPSSRDTHTHTHILQCDGINEVMGGRNKVECYHISCNEQIYLAESESFLEG